MIPVLSAAHIREADAFTIKNEPIASIDLMERASKAFVKKFLELFHPGKIITLFAGPGNNGGDALAIARILMEAGHRVEVYGCGDPEKATDDFKINFKRLADKVTINLIDDSRQIPSLGEDRVIIEGLFGSGLSRPVEGLFGEVIQAINQSGSEVFSIDIPSGLYPDEATPDGAIVLANHTISFQVPKLVFFHPEAASFVGRWHVVDIGLDEKFLQSQDTKCFLTEAADISYPVRAVFDHKGTAGRMLLVSGSKGKVGATTLSARAAMRSGCGLLFIHAPCCANDILQVTIPEAMVLSDEHQEIITGIELKEAYATIAIGPGIGTNALTSKALVKLLEHADQPLVIDADAINIVASDKNLIDLIPKQSILTPHPGEFRRLVGEWTDDFQKITLLRSFCQKHQLNVVLKGAFSAVCDIAGNVYFNPTGNPGMATAGSGDVLTGIIGALRCQGMQPFEAIRAGVYLHGHAGDLAKVDKGEISLMASDIIENIPSALRNKEN